ncbi:MAG: hypothetical protein AAF511_09090, partial [Pseudomonadota bacterium]
MPTDTSAARRTNHAVSHEAQREDALIIGARFWIPIWSLICAVLLFVDYKAAYILFSYLDPTLDGTSVGPAFLALTVPIAVIAIHLLIKDEGGP